MVPRGLSVADVTERLMVTYENEVPLELVSAVVLEARSNLSGQVPQGALPELLYRLAGQRLSHLAGAG